MSLLDRLLRRRPKSQGKDETVETVVRKEMQKALDRAIADLPIKSLSEKDRLDSYPITTLLDGPKGSFTVSTTMRLLPQVEQSGLLQDQSQEFDADFILVTVLPPSQRASLRFRFPNGYSHYLEQFELGRLDRGQAFTNWVICRQPGGIGIHLQYFSATGRGKPLVVAAADLLEPHERLKWLGVEPWIK